MKLITVLVIIAMVIGLSNAIAASPIPIMGSTSLDSFKMLEGKQMTPTGGQWINTSQNMYFGSGKNMSMGYNSTNNTLVIGGKIAFQGSIPKLTVIAGGAAGNHVMPGVALGDTLSGVLYVAKGAQNLTAITDVTSQFSTNATVDRITNWGGSSSAGGYLIISWIDR